MGSVILLCAIILFGDIFVTLLRLAPVNIFIITLWIPVLLGAPTLTALLYTLRINCAALLYMCFVIPMSISSIASALLKLKCSDKLIALLILTYRYIFLLNEKFFTALKSMRLRSLSKNNIAQWRSLGAVFTGAIITAMIRGEKVWTAMQCRGFDGKFPVTVVFQWKLRDTVMLILSVTCSVFFAIMEYVK
ncbi:hypothetical protein FACS1894102_5230 [Spirochaetia bacterium]|nr:hypothetical protein FACS1894102_5230 [Spirochaetia bacterium]